MGEEQQRFRHEGLFSNKGSFPSPKFYNRKWGRNNNDLGMKDCLQTKAHSPPLNSTIENRGGTIAIWAWRTVCKHTLPPLPQIPKAWNLGEAGRGSLPLHNRNLFLCQPVEFLRPTLLLFGKHAGLFDDFKFDVCHGYSCGLYFSIMAGLHNRRISSSTPSKFWFTSVFEKRITRSPSNCRACSRWRS